MHRQRLIGLIKKAFASAEEYWKAHPEMHEEWSLNYHTIELLDAEIPYKLLEKEHHWAEGSVPASFARWFRELYGSEEKPYILFFPIEDGAAPVCRYFAPVDGNWRYAFVYC